MAADLPSVQPLLWLDVEVLEHICTNFHAVARQIRQRYDSRPTLNVEDEYDVQDLIHCILRLYFEDIRPEEATPSYANKSSRMDFLLKDVQVVLEVKKTSERLGAKEVGTQLIDDIARYESHPESHPDCARRRRRLH